MEGPLPSFVFSSISLDFPYRFALVLLLIEFLHHFELWLITNMKMTEKKKNKKGSTIADEKSAKI